MSLTRHPMLSSFVVADIGKIRSRVNFVRVLSRDGSRDDGRPAVCVILLRVRRESTSVAVRQLWGEDIERSVLRQESVRF